MRTVKIKPNTIGFSHGKAITIMQLQEYLDQAERDIKKGRTLTTVQAREYFKARYGCV